MVVIMVHFNIQYNWIDFGYSELSEPHFVGAQELHLISENQIRLLSLPLGGHSQRKCNRCVKLIFLKNQDRDFFRFAEKEIW